jgi:hypothetical protein
MAQAQAEARAAREAAEREASLVTAGAPCSDPDPAEEEPLA